MESSRIRRNKSGAHGLLNKKNHLVRSDEMKTQFKMLAAVGVLAVSTPVSAHHSGAMFDDAKEITLSGTVTEFQYTTPHSWLVVSVPQADKQVIWSIEWGSPPTLMKVGITKVSVKPGDKVTFRAHPLKDGRPGAAMIVLTKADGTVLALHPPGAGKTSSD
jgi:hypothetical protein